MTREQAQFVNALCEDQNMTWTKIHIEYQKKFVDPSQWYDASTGYQKGNPLPHGSMIEGNELCKDAQRVLNL